MIALVQRVCWAEVVVRGLAVGRIDRGLLVYLGIGVCDAEADARRLAEKIATLRIFPDAGEKLNLSVQDARGGVLTVPNFTLLADASKGRRPTLDGAAGSGPARKIYEYFLCELRKFAIDVSSGIFGADMAVRSEADGPVNLIIQMPPRGQECGCPQMQAVEEEQN